MRLAQNRLELGVGIDRLLPAVHRVDIAVDVLHRAGTVEGDDCGQIVDGRRLQPPQRRRHAAALKLEHADRAARPKHGERPVIVQRNSLWRDLAARVLADELKRVRDGAEVREPEDVELEDADALDGLARELRHRLTVGRAHQRHVLDQGLP